MRTATILLTWVATALLSACGGGSSNSPAISPPTNSDDIRSRCNVAVGPLSIRSTVLAVYDGDTLTVSDGNRNVNVRLDGIDAPELAQPYGPASRDALRQLVLQRPVVVTYSTVDRYGRVLGRVFLDDCTHVNLQQLEAGMAWFYLAYQCELPQDVRQAFRAAQTRALASRLGLWALPDPQAPWIYRNGNDPPEPVCS